jgi:hypothetical protein
VSARLRKVLGVVAAIIAAALMVALAVAHKVKPEWFR